MKPIYKPSGKAKEYGDLAINIYTGCNHRCIYCFAPLVLKRDREVFHSVVEPRKGIVEAVKRQLDKEKITGQLIHLCFTCDPYPAEIDTTSTREIIKAIKESGNNVQILTKGGMRASRDFDLLDNGDWFGITLTCDMPQDSEVESNAENGYERIKALGYAKQEGINTWVSCEPVIDTSTVLGYIKSMNYVDLFRIGKLNYAGLDPKLKEIHDSIDWKLFGRAADMVCRKYCRKYYIKDSLRKIMEVKS